MKKLKMTTIEFSSIMELVSLPILFLLYQYSMISFWALLVYIDIMELYLVDIKQMALLFEPQYRDLRKRYRIYSLGLSLGYLILIFKDVTLAMILVGNDLLMTLLNPLLKSFFRPNHTDKQ